MGQALCIGRTNTNILDEQSHSGQATHIDSLESLLKSHVNFVKRFKALSSIWKCDMQPSGHILY